jgi:hypothetical protein
MPVPHCGGPDTGHNCPPHPPAMKKNGSVLYHNSQDPGSLGNLETGAGLHSGPSRLTSVAGLCGFVGTIHVFAWTDREKTWKVSLWIVGVILCGIFKASFIIETIKPWMMGWIGNDLEGSGRGLIDVLSRNMPGENWGNISVRIAIAFVGYLTTH